MLVTTIRQATEMAHDDQPADHNLDHQTALILAQIEMMKTAMLAAEEINARVRRNKDRAEVKIIGDMS